MSHFLKGIVVIVIPLTNISPMLSKGQRRLGAGGAGRDTGQCCAGAVHSTTKSSSSWAHAWHSTDAGTPGSCWGSLMSNKVQVNPGCAHVLKETFNIVKWPSESEMWELSAWNLYLKVKILKIISLFTYDTCKTIILHKNHVVSHADINYCSDRGEK